MANTGKTQLIAWNRGIISKYGLARVDIKRASFSAETMVNWVPRVLGSMMLRPGLQFLLNTPITGEIPVSQLTRSIPFIFSSTDFAQLECSANVLRPLINDAVITRATVTTTVANGTFGTDLANWTSADETAATSAWVAGGYMGLTGTGYNAAIRKQTVTVAGGNIGVEHAFRIVIQRGPVVFRAGSTDGDDNYIAETTLGTGTHSLAFTPAGDVFVQFSNSLLRQLLVDSIAIEGAGTLILPTPWGVSDLANLRWAQSHDVVYVACKGISQRKIERRATRSWSIVLYQPEDGPFRNLNLSSTTIKPSAERGEITLTASRQIFDPNHVGALFRLRSTGQDVVQVLAGPDQFTDSIRVVGVGTQRNFTITTSGTYVGTLILQASYDNGVTWVQRIATTVAHSGATAVSDTQDNAIILYRVGFVGSAYTSGSATVELTFQGGGTTGIARVTAYSSETVVSAEVLKYLGGINATSNWSEGTWSAYRGFPSETLLDQGRLWWFGSTRVIGSVSDAFESFDDTEEGDAGPIQRTIGRGTSDSVNWAIALNDILLGTASAEIALRSSALGELLSPTNFNLKDASTQGSAMIPAVKTDTQGFFVHKSQVALYQLEPNPQVLAGYETFDVGLFVPDLMLAKIVWIAVQRRPDTRIHCVLNDGTVAILIHDKLEDVSAWVKFETTGEVSDVCILPGLEEDRVIYTVLRNGTYMHEKWALESECRGGVLNKQADSFIVYSGTPTTVLSGIASEFEGEEMVVWADGIDFSPDVAGVQTTYTVSGGAVTLPSAVSSAIVGLPYGADFKSSKLAYLSQDGSALAQKKRVISLGLLMVDTHARALKYGQDFDHLDDMPQMEDSALVDADFIWDQYDKPSIPLNGKWDTDSRLCLRATAPRPIAIAGAILALEEVDKKG